MLWNNHIKDFILNTGEYLNYQPENNGTKLNLNDLYSNTRTNWTRKNGTLKFKLAQTNNLLVETWEYFKL